MAQNSYSNTHRVPQYHGWDNFPMGQVVFFGPLFSPHRFHPSSIPKNVQPPGGWTAAQAVARTLRAVSAHKVAWLGLELLSTPGETWPSTKSWSLQRWSIAWYKSPGISQYIIICWKIVMICSKSFRQWSETNLDIHRVVESMVREQWHAVPGIGAHGTKLFWMASAIIQEVVVLTWEIVNLHTKFPNPSQFAQWGWTILSPWQDVEMIVRALSGSFSLAPALRTQYQLSGNSCTGLLPFQSEWWLKKPANS